MSDATVRGQTQAILEHYEMRRDEIIDDDSGSLSPEQFSLLDAAARDAIRLLRENKTNYVRMEEASVARILGNPDLRQGIDVGYTAAKAEIDHAIGQVLAEKTKHRNMVRPPATAPPSTEDTVLVDRLKKLTELHKSGVLTTQEFAAAKSSLLQ